MSRWALLLLTACSDLGASTAPVIYGPTDDRVEVYEAPAGVMRSIAESAVAIQIESTSLDTRNPSDVRVTYDQTLGVANELCSGVRYEDQIEPGACSGTLIDAQHILTAGHCVEADTDCDGSTWPWLFGFYFEAPGRLHTLTSDDVYQCARVVVYQNDDRGDFAVVELDRPVVGHTPAPIRRTQPSVGMPLTVIGTPNGIPLKIAGNAHLVSIAGATLVADIDAFEGNSGSGVFDDDGAIVGIEVAGADDWVENGPCWIINQINPVPTGDGEDLHDAQRALEAYCQAMPSTLCTIPGDSCATAETLSAGTTNASLAGFANNDLGSCGGGMGNDRVYSFSLNSRSQVQLTTSGTDAVLYVRSACGGTELACNDDASAADPNPAIDITLDPGTYYVFVDGMDRGGADFSITLSTQTLATDGGLGDGGVTTSRGGCGCRTSGSRSGVAILFVVIAVLLRRRRS
jgi:V8-like Glu-specific endopeptidase